MTTITPKTLTSAEHPNLVFIVPQIHSFPELIYRKGYHKISDGSIIHFLHLKDFERGPSTIIAIKGQSETHANNPRDWSKEAFEITADTAAAAEAAVGKVIPLYWVVVELG
jgi:hypothetical protein